MIWSFDFVGLITNYFIKIDLSMFNVYTGKHNNCAFNKTASFRFKLSF